MIVPAEPRNEAERIADLHALRILDTPPEERFDEIVQLAAAVLDAPIAYIALVDSARQWFKAKCGVRPDQTGRDISFCGHAILQDEPLIVPDATRDARFSDNPLVVDDPRIRFYAGHPLTGPAGCNVGTFCIASSQPRSLKPDELALFRRFARLAERQLHLVDLVRTQHELIEVKNTLVAAQNRLREELSQAAAYVQSLLPAPIEGEIATDWRFISSSELGGDLFGYHWLDEHRFAIYLFDVCGHGVGAALLSISIFNALRRDGLLRADPSDPSAVLNELNRAFPMEEHHNKFFTMWYGVFDRRTRVLRYASGGHPAALAPDDAFAPQRLDSTGPAVGIWPDSTFDTVEVRLSVAARLYVFSDGIFEIPRPGGGTLDVDEFVALLPAGPTNPHDRAVSRIGAVLQRVRKIRGGGNFDDDASLLEVSFG